MPTPPIPDPQAATLRTALDHHRAGRLDAARAHYRTLLDRAPGDPEATHFLGVLQHQTGANAEGIALVRASLATAPGRSDWHNTLGNMLAACGQQEEAIAAFMAALEADARNALAWNNLGSLLLARGATADALRALQNATAIDPQFEDALHHLGDAWQQAGDAQAAARSHCAAYVVRPVPQKQRHLLGIAYCVLGRFEEAAAVYRAWLAEQPGHPEAEHLLAACTGKAVPARAPSGYLEAYFDAFAATFESKLLHNLDYGVPPRVGGLLDALGGPAHRCRILDAGCGTGLCGPYLKPHARHLVGVDLSAQSLAVAAGKGLYDTLCHQDIVAYMAGCASSAFDVVVAADTLIYFGDLAEVLAAAAHALAPGGLLLASFEHMDPASPRAPQDGGYAITPAGRYCHSRAYLQACCGAAGFAVSDMLPLDIRKELGQPVAGLLVVAHRAPPA